MKLFVALLVVGLPALAAAHSWIVCTDYLENNGWYWDQAKCRGWPRAATYYNLRFGAFGTHIDNNYTWRLDNHPEERALCREPRDDDRRYTEETPMAAYFLGQEVVLTHPANNHVAESKCRWRNTMDWENLMFVVDGDDDPCCIDSPKLIQIMDMGVSPYGRELSDEVLATYPKPGFQNVPKFCEDPDDAMGTYNFTIPMDLQPGRHIFVWKWIRDPAVPPFTTCWEADVFATKAGRDAHYLATGRSTEDMWDFYKVHNIVDGVIMDPVDPSINEIITG
ncbi:Hypp5267 [Branchiostoma lanceolatum]|uniref:Hypp5267 protein n=1 Tax=Branchiostoma lanceolatum TaxID=7740 RepID=A0A8K0AG38_BRALA|nr:Hypp5267 [Branchiostoma lanceolatum]